MGFERSVLRGQAHGPESRAQTAVFRFLESKWAGELKGRRIPTALRKKMRRDPAFSKMVDHYVEHGTLVADSAPRIVNRLDGRQEDRLAAELGDDPDLYYCEECGDEKGPNDARCAECAEADAKYQSTTHRYT